MGRVSDIKLPVSMLRPFIRTYAMTLGVEMDEVQEPSGGFESFGDFFARRLKPGARPVCGDPGVVISPCDGLITDFGAIEPSGSFSLTVKHERYDLDELLGASDCKERFQGGGYLIIYLHPRDYHRTHIPADGALTRIRHVAGTRYPVTRRFRNQVEGILGKNERVVFEFQIGNGAALAVAMVAAFGVGNIETSFAPESWIQSMDSQERFFEPSREVSKGMDLGAFRLGSTVVMVWSKGAITLRDNALAGPISMGHPIGQTVLQTRKRTKQE
jgi:phosphatidylserine decarboxylase